MSTLCIDELNRLGDTEVQSIFLRCCNSHYWAKAMSKLRPFASIDTVIEQASVVWEAAQESDILEAFSGHAKIGDLSVKRGEGASAATKKEQGQVAMAGKTTLDELSHLNRLYFEKFGFIYIVFATGKSAREMLELLQSRIENTREQELINGAIEQSKITNLRLKQLLQKQTA